LRYYRIELSRPSGEPVYLRSLSGQTLTSLTPQGKFNPGALQVELNIPLYPQHIASSGTYVKVWGVGLEDITRQSDFNGLNIKVYGGMSKGLPLASPNQSGLLTQGSIFQAYANWVGVEQSIVFLILPPIGTNDAPLNVPFTWPAGTPLASAIRSTLQIAAPTLTPQINISPNLVLAHTETGYYTSLTQFAQWINERSRSIIGGGYAGVQIATKGDKIQVWDGTQSQTNVISIQPWDLIGQPTWQENGVVTFATVMRADIDLQSVIKLPPTIIQQTAASAVYIRNQDRTAFTGNFLIQGAQHYGNFRQPSADSWNTTFQCVPDLKDTAPVPAGNVSIESIVVTP
jgi:hypothetical protein